MAPVSGDLYSRPPPANLTLIQAPPRLLLAKCTSTCQCWLVHGFFTKNVYWLLFIVQLLHTKKQQLVHFLCVFYAEVYFQIYIVLWRKGQTDQKCLSSGSKGYICSWANQPLDLIWLENPKLGAKVDKILKQQWRSMLGWMASRKSRQTTEPAASQRNDRTRKKRRVCLQLSAILGIVGQ